MTNYFDIMRSHATSQHYRDITKDLTSVVDGRGNYYNEDTGGLLKKVDPKLIAIDDLVTTGGTLSTSECSDDHALFNDVSYSMRQLPGVHTYETALKIVANLHASLKHEFYGVLFKEAGNPTHFINPLHPLAAVHLLSTPGLRVLSCIILVYTYKDRAALQRTLGTQPTSEDIPAIKKNINSLLVAPVEKVKKRHLFTKPVYDFKDVNNVTIYEEVANISQVYLAQSTSYLVAHQVLARGVAVPYYGTSLLRKESDTTNGIGISPMLSSNIGSTSKRVYRSICTGSAPKTTLEGLSTLHHANMSSRLNGNIIHTDALIYADLCQHISLNLFAKAGIVPPVADYTLPLAKSLFTKAELKAYTENPKKYTYVLLGSMSIEKAKPILIALEAARKQNENID